MAEIKWICGLPWEEAQWVLELYKEKKAVPTGDYADGFKDGVEYAQKIFEKQLEKSIKIYLDCEPLAMTLGVKRLGVEDGKGTN